MDDHRFDAVARTFASGRSRRQTFRLLAASLFAPLLPGAVGAAPLRQDDGCGSDLIFCEEQPGWAPAGCYALASDYLHCGSCTNQCPSAGPVEMACIGGACTVIGCGDFTDCTGNLDCADLSRDPYNCGSCGTICESGVCDGGVCAPVDTDCGMGLTFCPFRSDGQPAGCYNLAADYWHCGTCDLSCPTAGFHGVCDNGQCVEISCPASLTYCPAQEGGLQPGCFDLMSDPRHCGGCDIRCYEDACVQGYCP